MGTILVIFVLGSVFGLIIQYANLNKYNVISAQSELKNNTVLKTILLTIGLGAILLSVIIGLGFANFHIKPFVVGGIIIGGLIFGSGMAILGYCPGTLAVSLGEGSLDALIGIVGGLFGGLVYTILLPNIQWLIGANFGEISLFSVLGTHKAMYFTLVFIIGISLIYSTFLINRKEKNTDKKWIIAGIALAVLNGIVFLSAITNRPIGASTS